MLGSDDLLSPSVHGRKAVSRIRCARSPELCDMALTEHNTSAPVDKLEMRGLKDMQLTRMAAKDLARALESQCSIAGKATLHDSSQKAPTGTGCCASISATSPPASLRCIRETIEATSSPEMPDHVLQPWSSPQLLSSPSESSSPVLHNMSEASWGARRCPGSTKAYRRLTFGSPASALQVRYVLLTFSEQAGPASTDDSNGPDSCPSAMTDSYLS